MRYLILMVTIITPFISHAAYHQSEIIDWPNAKYETGDCITPVDPVCDWYGKAAKVLDLMYSKDTKQFMYHLRMQRNGRFDGVVYFQQPIESLTRKLTRCPS